MIKARTSGGKMPSGHLGLPQAARRYGPELHGKSLL